MTNTASIRAITFDVGGTLIEPWPSVGHVYAAVATESGAGEFDPSLLNRKFLAAWRAKVDFDYSKRAWRSLVEATFAGLVAEGMIKKLFPVLYERFAEPGAWRVFDDVFPALQELRAAGFKLGVISNWDERLVPLLDRLDLTHWFDVITVSFQTGAAKPAPGIFQQASVALGVPSESILHVGDSLDEDVRGAQAAGFSGVLVDRGASNSWALNTLAAIPPALGQARLGSEAD